MKLEKEFYFSDTKYMSPVHSVCLPILKHILSIIYVQEDMQSSGLDLFFHFENWSSKETNSIETVNGEMIYIAINISFFVPLQKPEQKQPWIIVITIQHTYSRTHSQYKIQNTNRTAKSSKTESGARQQQVV